MSGGGYERIDAGASKGMLLNDIWALIRRRKWYIIVPVVLACGAALAISLSETPRYRSSAEVLVEAAPQAGVVSGEQAVSDDIVNNEVTRAAGDRLQQMARDEVGDEPALSVTRGEKGDALVFSAESRSARKAADAANAYADAYVVERRSLLVSDFEDQTKLLDEQLEDAEDRLDALSNRNGADADEIRQRIAELRTQIEQGQSAARLADSGGASVVGVAEVPDAPFAPKTDRAVWVASLLGLILGLVVAFVRDRMDNSIRNPEDLQRVTGMSISAVIPRVKTWKKKTDTHLVMVEAPLSPQSEAYRALRARIQFRRTDKPIQVVLVTSPRPGEGKTTTSTNLAVAFATAGERTVLVDLDLRRPRVHKFFDLGDEYGISSVLNGGDLPASIHELSEVPNLAVVPAGPSTDQSTELLNNDRLGEVMSILRDQFDVVVIDTPPVLAVADPLTISRYSDGVLTVVSASGTKKRDAEIASGQLAEVQAPVLGAVLNNYNAAQSGYSYSYTYSEYRATRPVAPTETGHTETGHAEKASTAETPITVSAAPQSSTAEPPKPPKLSRRQRKRLAKEQQMAAAAQPVPLDFSPESIAAATTDADHPDRQSTQHDTLQMGVVGNAPTAAGSASVEVGAPTLGPTGGNADRGVGDGDDLTLRIPSESDPDVGEADRTEVGGAQPDLTASNAENTKRSEIQLDDAYPIEAAPVGSVEATPAPNIEETDGETLHLEHVVVDESTSEIDRPIEIALRRLAELDAEFDRRAEDANVTSSVGPKIDHTVADLADDGAVAVETVEVAPEDLQQLLRSEMRQALLEHRAERPGSESVPTVKVVLVPDDEPATGSSTAGGPDIEKAGPTRTTARKTTAKKKATAKKKTTAKRKTTKAASTKTKKKKATATKAPTKKRAPAKKTTTKKTTKKAAPKPPTAD